MASVDSVSNNNTGAYTIGGAALGAIGGGTYGYFSKPWLKDGAPNDAFYRTAGEKMMETGGEESKIAKEYVSLVDGLKKAKNTEEFVSAQSKFITSILKKTVGDDIESAKNLIADEGFLKQFGIDVNIVETEKTNLIELTNKVKSFDELAEVMSNQMKQEIDKHGFETVKKEMSNMIETLQKAGIPTNSEDMGRLCLADLYDSSKKEFKLGELTENGKKAVTETMSSMKTKAALKWAGIGAAALGIIGFIVAKCTGKSEPLEETKLDAQA